MNYREYIFYPGQEKDYQDLAKVNFTLHRLNAGLLCPFAAHMLFPYVLSFQKGSWFRWMKDKNSVMAQCPNPHVCLTFTLTRGPGHQVSAEVISKKADCLAGHKAGDCFSLALDPQAPPRYAACAFNHLDDLAVSIVSHSPACRYYSRPGQTVARENLAPKGFCLPAYYTAYPYSLSLLYDGIDFLSVKNEKAADILCPNDQDRVRIRVRTKKNIFSPLMNLLEKALRLIGSPQDALDKTIWLEVLGVEKHCPKGLQSSQEYKFNLRDRRELCPALFYGLFPFLAMLNKRVFPYWAREQRLIDVHCPDHGADIVYRIERKP